MTLILLGAPLGNVADASQRLRTTLASADIVAAEDTRRFGRLASDLGIGVPGKVVSYFEGNERHRTADLVEALVGGATVVLVTDGGMPSVSDPGFRLVRAAVDAEVPVTAVPGPSAVTTALAVSGLPSDRFCFEGFPPRKRSERRAFFAELAAERRTLIFFESPHRIAGTLVDLAEAFGADRPAAVCRELTKTYEEVNRATLGELADWAGNDQLRGEITLVVHGAVPTAAPAPTGADLAAEVEAAVVAGTPRKTAIAAVARERGLPKRVVYDAVVLGRTPESPAHGDHPDQ